MSAKYVRRYGSCWVGFYMLWHGRAQTRSNSYASMDDGRFGSPSYKHTRKYVTLKHFEHFERSGQLLLQFHIYNICASNAGAFPFRFR